LKSIHSINFDLLKQCFVSPLFRCQYKNERLVAVFVSNVILFRIFVCWLLMHGWVEFILLWMLSTLILLQVCS